MTNDDPMNKKSILVLSIGLGVSGLVLIYFVGIGESKQAGAHAEHRPSRAGPDATTEGAAALPRDDASSTERVDRSESAASARRSSATKAERQRRRRMLQKRFGRASARDELTQESGAPAISPLPPESWTSLPEDYISGIIREQLIPVAEGCYEDLAEAGARGALTLKVVVIGDEEIGGVIDSIEVNPKKTSLEGELIDCVYFAAYEMEFDPPEDGQSVAEFEFSLNFSDEDKKG